MRFAVNIAMMFGEQAFLDRFAAAADSGFDAVEFWWPDDTVRDRVREAAEAAGVTVIRFALDAGSGHAGLLCDPRRAAQFRHAAREGLELASELGCTMVNALIGTRIPEVPRQSQLDCGRDNLAWLAEQAAAAGVRVLVEANSTVEKPGYLVDTTAGAQALVDGAGHDNLALLYDVYHMHLSGEDVLETFAMHLPSIQHVQIADAPGRHEPGTGEIDFGVVLPHYHDLGYRGYVGLEYRPTSTTVDGLGWLPRELRAGPVDRDALARLPQ